MTEKLVKMINNANCPQDVPSVGEVNPGDTFEVTKEMASHLENGLFTRATVEVAEEKPKKKATKKEANK